MPMPKLAQITGLRVKRRIPDDAPLYAGEGAGRVRVIPSSAAHEMLLDTGASFSRVTYRLKSACADATVRYVQVDAVRRLYALDDLQELAEYLRVEHDAEQTQG